MKPVALLRQWIFRLRRDETLPIVLGQRRIFILPTGTGYLFAVVLVVMLLGAINYTLSLGHALVFLLAGLGLTAMVHTFRNLLGIAITPGRPSPAHAGETARFPLHLNNTRHDTRRALTIGFATGNEVRVDLPACGSARIEVPCPATRRGILDPGRLTLSTRYPIDLFRAWSYPYPKLSCLVYPAPILRPLPPPVAVDNPGFAHGTSGHEDFAGLRAHTPSDPPRHIAWKAVARSAEAWPLLVKHFAGGAGEELWLEWTQLAAEVDDETRLSVLTGWVIAADNAHLAYGLALPGWRVAPATGTIHRDRCLEALALYGLDDHVPQTTR
jgi:uncharacterized protein (DUF58 family)